MKIIFLAILLWLTPQAFAFNEQAFIEMNVDALIDESKSKAVLKFSLKYTGDSTLVVDSHNLPGMRVARSISYMADSIIDYKSKPFKLCPKPKEKIFFDEGAIGYYELNPGEVLTQHIDLYQVYSEFEKILGVCDFVFYWNYKLDIENGYEAPRLAGAVVIPSTLQVTNPLAQKAKVIRQKRARAVREKETSRANEEEDIDSHRTNSDCNIGKLCEIRGQLDIYRGVPISVGILTKGEECLTLALPETVLKNFKDWDEKRVLVKGKSYAKPNVDISVISYTLLDRTVGTGMCNSPVVLYVSEVELIKK